MYSSAVISYARLATVGGCRRRRPRDAREGLNDCFRGMYKLAACLFVFELVALKSLRPCSSRRSRLKAENICAEF